MSEGEPKNYDIFNDFETLETIRTQMENDYENADNSTFCDEINCQTNKLEQIKMICKMFVSLYNNTKTQCRSSKSNQDCSKYPEFMNFWLNYELNRAGYSDIEQRQFYNEMTLNNNKFQNDNMLQVKLSVIMEKYFNNMNILYQLYKMIYSSSELKYTKCDDFMQDFKKIYNEGLKKCYLHGDYNLGKGLESFKKIYEKINLDKVPICKEQNVPTLPKLSVVDNTDNILRTFYIARKLLQNKYYKDLKDLISVHYNLLFEYKEEEQNCLMIRILHQFFQYCNDYKYNRKLSSFMEEFIKEYYDKKKDQYQTISKECKGPENGKKYCMLFKQCENTFNKDLKIFQSNATDYITEQEKYISSLSGFDILLFEAKAMFQDFEKISRYLPTIMSTMAAILVCLFFLHKIIPLNSIFRKGKKKRKKIPLFFPERIEYVNDENNRHKNVKPKRGKIRFSYQPT
ncbi:hypothetical protein PVPAM_060005400 [Plasmodium vivax]|nr:hypothetical protein PVPAM_060005400 [Plasmodium vivax]